MRNWLLAFVYADGVDCDEEHFVRELAGHKGCADKGVRGGGGEEKSGYAEEG